MSDDNEIHTRFRERWPDMFTNVRSGFWLPGGWEKIMWSACEELEPVITGTDFRVDQVKSKFGGLRFYVGNAPYEAVLIIDKVEELSSRTCAKCGMYGTRRGDRYISTLCATCAEASK